MELSAQSLELLKWFGGHDGAWSRSELAQNCKGFDEECLETLVEREFVKMSIGFNSLGDTVGEYRIADPGKAYLRENSRQKTAETREWVTLIIALLSFFSGVAFSEPVKGLLTWMRSLLG